MRFASPTFDSRGASEKSLDALMYAVGGMGGCWDGLDALVYAVGGMGWD